MPNANTRTAICQLADLVAKSFVRCDTDGRYRLHENIRQFAVEKPDASHAEAARPSRKLLRQFIGNLSRNTTTLSSQIHQTCQLQWRLSALTDFKLGVRRNFLATRGQNTILQYKAANPEPLFNLPQLAEANIPRPMDVAGMYFL